MIDSRAPLCAWLGTVLLAACNGAAPSKPPPPSTPPSRARPRVAAPRRATSRIAAPLPAGVVTRLVDQRGLYGGAHSLAVSPDGTAVAIGGMRGQLAVWDRASGAVRAHLEGHRSEVRQLAWSPDGRLLGSADTVLRLWDTRTAHRVATIGTPGKYMRIFAFSPDGRRVVSYVPADGVVIHRVDGQRERRLAKPGKFVVGLAWRGNRILVHESGGGASLWDPSSGRRLVHARNAGQAAALDRRGRLLAFGGPKHGVWLGVEGRAPRLVLTPRADQKVSSLRFSTDGSRLAVTYQEGTLVVARLARTGSATVLGRASLGKSAYDPRWTPDGNTLVVSCNRKRVFHLCVLDTSPLRLRRVLAGDLHAVVDARHALSLRFRGYPPALVDLQTGKRVREYRGRDLHPTRVEGPLEVTPGGALDVRGRALYRWSGARVPLAAPRGRTGGIRVARDGKTLLWTRIENRRERVEVVSLITGKVQLSHDWKKAVLFPSSPDNYQYRPTSIRYLAFAPDGSWFATLGPRGAAEIRDARTGQLRLSVPPYQNTAWRFAASPDSRVLAVLGYDGARPAVRLVDVRTRKVGPRRRFALPHVDGITWAPDGTSLWARDGRYGIEGRRLQGWRRLFHRPGRAEWVVLHPRGRLVVDVPFGSQPIRAWDPQRKRVAWSVVAPYAHAAVFSPDGRYLALAGGTTVTVHDVATGATKATLSTRQRLWRHGYRGRYTALAWTPDGKALLTAGTCVRAWRARDGATARFCAVARKPQAGVVWITSDGVVGGAPFGVRALVRRVAGGLSGPLRVGPARAGRTSFVQWLGMK